jgi:HrpA-like RNA helicase
MIVLKIDQIKERFLAALDTSDVVIVITPTGSGKTLRVPQWCWEWSGNPVYCAMPRVMMARKARKDAQKTVWGGDKKAVGVMTSRETSGRGKVLYGTDGAILNRSAMDSMPKGSVVCIDEAHEQGVRTEAVLSKSVAAIRAGQKIVVLSATIDPKEIVAFFDRNGASVSTLNLPDTGRPFEVEIEVSENPLKDIAAAAMAGGRCLVGMEGKKEIEDASKIIASFGFKGKIFPLHGELETEEIDEALNYKGPCVYVATDVAQSGITIDKLSHGYFSGFCKTIIDVGGRFNLMRTPLSSSEWMQWIGRLGRVCPGKVFMTAGQKAAFESAPFMPLPEIRKMPLASVYTDFKKWGVCLRTSPMLNRPEEGRIASAEETLQKLGYLDRDKKITLIGKKYLAIGEDPRHNILIFWGNAAGFSATARKAAAIERIGHPFRETPKSYFSGTPDFGCEILLYAMKLDEIFERYAGEPKAIWQEHCEKNGVFRKKADALQKAFEKIDCFAEYHDEGFTPSKFKMAMYLANLDRIAEFGRLPSGGYVETSFKVRSSPGPHCYYFGEIVSVGTKTFIEMPTWLSKEEKDSFDKAMGLKNN